jgi:hypothetical protein
MLMVSWPVIKTKATMSDLKPEKQHVTYQGGASEKDLSLPRCYTLTHSDRTGELFLTIGPEFDRRQISGWYTRLMRDEALAELRQEGQAFALHIHVHVSGGLALGSARMRDDILHHHMPLVIEAIAFADRRIFSSRPELMKTRVWVHYVSNREKYDRVEDQGTIDAYKSNPSNLE